MPGGAQFTCPLVIVIPGQLITASLWLNEFYNISNNLNPLGLDGYEDTDAMMQIQTNPYPGSVTSHASSLGGEIERIRYVIAQITGSTYWYEYPTTPLGNLTIPIGGSFFIQMSSLQVQILFKKMDVPSVGQHMQHFFL